MFNQIITVFQGFFSRAFWFGSFLPVTIFAGVHMSIAALQVPDTVRLWYWLTGPPTAAAVFPVVLACLVVLAYALTPLIPLFRGWLDGTLLPAWLHDTLRREHGVRARQGRTAIADAMNLFNTWDRLNRDLVADFWPARVTGLALGTATDDVTITNAERMIESLRRQIDAGWLPPATTAQQTADGLAAALRANAARLPPNHPDAARSARLEKAHRILLRLLADAATEARHRFNVFSARYASLALDDPQATRIGDARMMAESYSAKVYRVDFDYVWPRLQLAFPDQGTFLDRIVAARSQIDFAVLSLALMITVPVVWLPVLALTAQSPLLFLGVGSLAPLLAGFLYELVVQSQIAFGEVVKTAVDKFRLDVLTKILHQPLPATRAVERDIWHRLQTAEELGDLADLTYRHPAI